jgi:hypothetical protein
MTICTVSAREARARIEKQQQHHNTLFENGSDAATALLWFADHAMGTDRRELPGYRVFKLKADMLEMADKAHPKSVTAEIAARFLEHAAATYADKILADAIALAQRTLKTADDLTRPQQPRPA